jgi:hypothetical protein
VEHYGAIAILEESHEGKGLNLAYVSKESQARGRLFIANKGPHTRSLAHFHGLGQQANPHVRNKANALYYIPIWRTWFACRDCASSLER